MTNEQMREALARVLADELYASLDPACDEDFDDLAPAFQERFRCAADAAITAARLFLMEEVAWLRKIEAAARGLVFGEDWNNGTHAKIYRPQLINALKEPQA